MWGRGDDAEESRASLLRVLVPFLLACDLSFLICKMGLRKPSSQVVPRTDKGGLCSWAAQCRCAEDGGQAGWQGCAREAVSCRPWRGDSRCPMS